MAQGAVMALEDGWVLAEHVGSQAAMRTAGSSGVDWDAALAAYNAVRPEHCRRVVLTARAWGEMWHLEGLAREQRNTVLRGRETRDYSFTDWIYGPTALTPEQEPDLYQPLPLDRGEPTRISSHREQRVTAGREVAEIADEPSVVPVAL
jgi:salicylate hydroxylase